MASGIDMTLDDLIKKSKQSKPPRSRPAPAVAGPGLIKRDFKRRAPRPSAVPYSVNKVEAVPEGTWKHDLFAAHAAAYPAQAARASAIETGTKLYISNLDYGVSNEDIKELFSEVGDLKRCGVHYDRSGRSKGTADVVFSRRADALAAVKRYNNVQLDGKPMKIEVVGTNIATPAPVPAFVGGGAVQNGAPRSAAHLIPLCGSHRAAKQGDVSLDVLVAVEAVGVDGEFVVEEEAEAEAVGRKSLSRILMQSWRNIMQEQWKQIDGVLLAALWSTIRSVN
ncbi:THO complex subunit 4A-like protein [Drosera capensis]